MNVSAEHLEFSRPVVFKVGKTVSWANSDVPARVEVKGLGILFEAFCNSSESALHLGSMVHAQFYAVQNLALLTPHHAHLLRLTNARFLLFLLVSMCSRPLGL